MRTVDALVCLRPGELRVERRPGPRPAEGEVLVRPLRVVICGRLPHLRGYAPLPRIPPRDGSRARRRAGRAGRGPERRRGLRRQPYVACGACVACRNGKPNCCVRIAVLGVHPHGGMAGLLAVPAVNIVPAAGLTPDQCAAVEFLAIGAHAVRRGALSGRDRALVVGAVRSASGLLLTCSPPVLDHCERPWD